jgi:uracil-DNA glycosylase family 4
LNNYCSKCNAYNNCNNPCIIGFGDEKAPVLFIGETTGLNEDYYNTAIYNKEYIIDCMEQFGSYYYTNAIKCKLVDKKGNLRKPTATEIDCCKVFTYKIINEMKPKVIVAMGSLVLKQLLGINMSIDVAHGKEFFHPYFNCYIIPTWDSISLTEEYIISNGKKTFIDNKLYKKQFMDDLGIVFNKLKEAPKRKLYKELKTISNPVDVQEYLESLLTKEELVIDLETTGLDSKKDSITDVGLSTSPNEGIHILWKDIMPHFELLKKVLESDIKVINHNIRFDAHFLSNIGIVIKNMYFP